MSESSPIGKRTQKTGLTTDEARENAEVNHTASTNSDSVLLEDASTSAPEQIPLGAEVKETDAR